MASLYYFEKAKTAQSSPGEREDRSGLVQSRVASRERGPQLRGASAIVSS
jgi:hypothetical protein